MKTCRVVLIIAAIQAFISCKQFSNDDQKSESKNIEVAAQGINEAVKKASDQTSAVEYCLEDETGSPVKAINGDSNATVKAIIKKLPARLAKEYENVTVTLFADAKQVHEKCLEVNGKTTASKALGDELYVACWGPSSKTEVSNVRPEIFLLDNIDNIHNNLIVMVISSYFELYIDQIMARFVSDLKTDDHPKRVAFESIKSSRKELAAQRVAFESIKSSRKELAAQFAGVLDKKDGKDVKDIYKKAFLGNAKIPDDSLVSDLGFQNFVLSEVAESAYCSSSTVKVLKEDKYKKVMAAFTPFETFFKSVP